MHGALLPVTFEWIILALAPILAVATCLRDALWSRGIFGFRNGIAGPASDVTRDGLGEDFTDVFDQLSLLSFRPVGVYWEKAVLSPKFREYVFVNPQRDCFAAVYRLFGKDINVMLMTTFKDGAIVKTYDSPGESFDKPDYVVRRLPSKPVVDLLNAHQATVRKFIADGRMARSSGDMDSITIAQKDAFYHPTVSKDLQQTGRTMLRAKLVVLGSCAAPLLLISAGLAMWPVIKTMLLLGAAAWVITVSVLFLSLRPLIKLMSTGNKNQVADSPEPELYAVRLAKYLPLACPVFFGAVWQFDAASVARWTFVIVSCVSAIDLIRIFCRAARQPFASTNAENVF